MKNKEKKFKQKRKWWYRALKSLMKVRYKKPEFIYLGEKPKESSIILSNHEGTDAPMSLEIYADFPVRMWGTHEMNSGLVKLYKYQTKVYYHQKKHWNLFAARMFCLIASPPTNLFYKGLNLISTYHDARFKTTLTQSSESILDKKENIVIFPEKSPNGYVPELEGFYAGFLALAKVLEKKGLDVSIYVAYYKKQEKQYIFGSPYKYSELKIKFKEKDEIINFLLNECNRLGKLQFKK
ncbi:MAG: hypothetical protein ACI4T1_02190 [Christensenellales bacterium]